jgi:membrane protease YdiL (CAAX protease family)
VHWYAAALLILLIMIVLLTLSVLVSPDFASGFFPIAILGSLVAGYLEEIGWMGYALPRMQLKSSALSAGILLGLLHGVWHLMAGYLGSAQDLGVYFFPPFCGDVDRGHDGHESPRSLGLFQH